MATQNSLNNQTQSDFTVLNSNLRVGVASPADPKDLNIEKTTVGDCGMQIRNLSANAAAEATIGIVVQDGGGDASVAFQAGGIIDFRMGVDNSVAGDPFKISSGAAIGTNDTFIITSAGEITQPLQPAFLATHSVDQLNVTGNNTQATINFTTEIFDQNSDYDGTNTFTAPIAGRYRFSFSVTVSDITAPATQGYVGMFTSNRVYYAGVVAPGVVISSGAYSWHNSSLCDMDAADTCICAVVINGMGADTADFLAFADNTYFSGNLEC